MCDGSERSKRQGVDWDQVRKIAPRMPEMANRLLSFFCWLSVCENGVQ